MATALSPDHQVNLARAGSFRLGSAEVQPAILQIRNNGVTQLLEPRVMQMLVALYAAGGATVTKQQLIENCWGGLAVSDDAITQCVSKLRRELADVRDVRVETVARVGYRLVVTREVEDQAAGPERISRRGVIAASVVATIAGGAGGWVLLGPGALAKDESIAVLPFADLSGDPAQAYFSEGLAEEVRDALARLPRLKVMGRTSSEAVRNDDATMAARRLHVSTILTGSIRRSRTMIRVAAQLIDARTGFERWSHTYDLAPGDSLRLQSDIAEGVALALSAKLGRADRLALAAGGTRDSAANDLYLQAKLAFRLSDTEATFRRVIALCDAAIGVDPAFGSAYALKGMAWDAIGSSFSSDTSALHQAYGRGAEAARRAIAINPQAAAGYVALARSMSGQLNVRGAFDQYRIAERLSGTDPGILSWWIQTLAEIGRTTQALELSEKLIALDPLNPAIFGRKAFAHYFARNYRLSIESSRKALELAPGLTEQTSLIGDCLCLLGRYEEAALQYAKAPPLDPYRITGEAFVAARTGNRAGCQRILDSIQRAFGDPASFQMAQIHAQLGQTDEAFAALEKGRQALDPGLNGLPADPFVDPLRSDRRFNALLKRLDLA